eukprot:gnl/TRDRNA2_/TRDRNA2_146410_c0_seq2.p1 gnl/TRDRNA2_/TRDRNA2_146410_c0~~gnl/TRDRNA2_/TRDRNA2_146410_c0_seq2.p1  ORF type:complete len:363 (-),score=50.59 gnl/TRDRNA2_/TRDRNA2_146410_c0_seq2:49-1137(-)
MKVGVVVNDVAAANIDAAMISLQTADGLVGLRNGCICCSSRDGLVEGLRHLVESGGTAKSERPWDHFVVECSGVAEPDGIASELQSRVRRNDPLMRRISLSGIVCIVDASTFVQTYQSPDSGGKGRKPLSALLVHQIESSDSVVINKADLVASHELRDLSALIAALNPVAKCHTATSGALPLSTLLAVAPAQREVPSLGIRHIAAVNAVEGSSHHSGHDCDHDHDHGPGHDHDAGGRHARYGLSSFVYRRQGLRFKPADLAAVARQLPVVAAELGGRRAWPPGQPAPHKVFEGVLRSKGFIWVKGDQRAYYWSHAGKRLRLSEFSGAVSDMQELVFIGRGMDEATIVDVLDGCLDRGASAKL